MKTLFTKLVILLSILFILTGCENENDINENQQIYNRDFIINDLSSKDLSSNSIVQKGYRKLNFKKSKFENHNKSSVNNIYNFIIDSSRIREILKDKYISYTLLIKRPFKTPEYFENLVIEQREDEGINAYIIKYKLKSKIKVFEDHHTFSFDASSHVIPLDLDNLNLDSKSNGGCMLVAQTWCSWGGEPHVAGHNCFMADDGRTYIAYVVDANCNETGRNPRTIGGGNIADNTPNPIITSPLDSDGNPVEFPNSTPVNEINEILGNSLSEDQLFWLYDHSKQADQIKLFLDNNNSTAAYYFAMETIVAMMSGAEVDFENEYNLDLIQFESIQEFLENIDSESLASSTLIDLQDNIVNSIAEFTINRSPLTPCKLDVIISSNYNSQEDCYDFDNVNTSLSGFTTPYNFEQSSEVNSVIDGDYIFISLSGTLTTGLNIQGYGLFYSETIIIEIRINRFNGEFDTAKIIR